MNSATQMSWKSLIH